MGLSIKKSLIFLFVMPFCMMAGVLSAAQSKFPMVYGLNYAPEHYNMYYNGDKAKLPITDASILRDFDRISQNFNGVRIHEFNQSTTGRILEAAKCYDMTAVVGISIDSKDSNYTDAQVSGLEEMFKKNPGLLNTVTAVVLEHRSEPLTLPSKPKSFFYFLYEFNKLRDFVKQQDVQTLVGISADDSFFESIAGNALLMLLPSNTPIFINVNPYMAGCSVNAATAQTGQIPDYSCDPKQSFLAKLKRIENNLNLTRHQVIIGETGWPSDGQSVSSGGVVTRPGNIGDAIQFFNFLYSPDNPIQKKQIPVFLLSAFDDPNALPFGGPSNFSGIYNFDSTPKNGMVYPPLVINEEPPKQCNLQIVN